jgi:glycosyltransferase involved in cell wall biosynthesis
MRILIATDAFPPVSGGSGWSTYELANGLRARGHHIFIVQPYSKRPPAPYDGFDVHGYHVTAPGVPFVQNYFRNERLYRRLGSALATLIREHRFDVIHAQHELTGPASVRAARTAGIPSVCTIRDYWPLCYWSDLVRDPAAGDLCPGCSAGAMTRCLPPRVGAAWPLTTAFIPYMRANLRGKQSDLAAADAIVAVSEQVASYLRERSPEIAAGRIEVIPNGVDIARIRSLVAAAVRPMDEPYAVFIGKLARNKGVSALVDVVERAGLKMPLVVIGDGPERATLLEAASRSRTDIRVLQWMERDEVFRWLGHAEFLIFPSSWPEPLSRVLLEASALSRPIAAMNTGGTADVVVDEVTGLLSATAVDLAEDVARLAADSDLRARFSSAAGRRAEELFDVPVIVTRMEALYADVIERARKKRERGVA